MSKVIYGLLLVLLATPLFSQTKPTIEWVSIPAGTFTMGSPENEVDRTSYETQHQVTLSAFKMSKYEVTFEQYDIFCDSTGRSKPSDTWTRLYYNNRTKRYENDFWGRGKRPVMNVSWYDAKAFANWMGCRLPTEAEWEYACRAGTITPFNTGNNLTSSQANYDGNYPYDKNESGTSYLMTLPVGRFAPNAWGLYDMHGNVWEWCSDWYDEYSTVEQTNPEGPASGDVRACRGGSWYRDADECRSAKRYFYSPQTRSTDLGFRLVTDQ
jgi:sulfatase modifying factor 1